MDRRNFLGGAGLAGAGAVLMAPAIPAHAAPEGAGAGTRLVASRSAPAWVRRAADFVCTGTRDDVVINRALASCGTEGGTVRLTRGTFDIAAPIRMRKRTALVGEGPASILKARGTWAAYDGRRPGSVVEPLNDGVSKTAVRFLAIDGNRGGGRANTGGIYYRINRANDFDEGPDAMHVFADLYIHDTESHGLHVAGGRMRATLTSNVRVYNAGNEAVGAANGIRVESPDGTWSNCDVGSSAGHGIFVQGTNNRFMNCKSWYSRGNGWHVRTPRNMFSSCEAQDNVRHGFYVGSGPNSFVGCHADSNSWNSNANASVGDGFHLPWSTHVQLVGCSAYDKNESQRGNWQRFGIYMGGACAHCQVIATARDNASGSAGGSGVGNASNVVMVSG